ncbi:hypothetical protein AGLY_010668 [Aphis glycines]|uniref:Uncharacterized protein n=1 Tax=Aphis glycines TaxID=307491 RepID=A0A6G0TE76_APHGL|nr:hypothetical protein AGLY_010668 [Aphis glycines]
MIQTFVNNITSYHTTEGQISYTVLWLFIFSNFTEIYNTHYTSFDNERLYKTKLLKKVNVSERIQFIFEILSAKIALLETSTNLNASRLNDTSHECKGKYKLFLHKSIWTLNVRENLTSYLQAYYKCTYHITTGSGLIILRSFVNWTTDYKLLNETIIYSTILCNHLPISDDSFQYTRTLNKPIFFFVFFDTKIVLKIPKYYFNIMFAFSESNILFCIYII